MKQKEDKQVDKSVKEENILLHDHVCDLENTVCEFQKVMREEIRMEKSETSGEVTNGFSSKLENCHVEVLMDLKKDKKGNENRENDLNTNKKEQQGDIMRIAEDLEKLRFTEVKGENDTTKKKKVPTATLR